MSSYYGFIERTGWSSPFSTVSVTSSKAPSPCTAGAYAPLSISFPGQPWCSPPYQTPWLAARWPPSPWWLAAAALPQRSVGGSVRGRVLVHLVMRAMTPKSHSLNSSQTMMQRLFLTTLAHHCPRCTTAAIPVYIEPMSLALLGVWGWMDFCYWLEMPPAIHYLVKTLWVFH